MLMAPLDYLDSWTALCAPSPAPDSECAWVSDKICGNRSKEEEIGGQRRTGRTTLSFSYPSFGVPVLFDFYNNPPRVVCYIYLWENNEAGRGYEMRMPDGMPTLKEGSVPPPPAPGSDSRSDSDRERSTWSTRRVQSATSQIQRALCLLLNIARTSFEPVPAPRHAAHPPAIRPAPPRAAAVRCACGCAVRGLRLKQNKSSPALDA